jgi:signal transduction histidine kinase
MDRQLRLLVVEDSEDDAALLALEVRRGGYALTHQRVETAETMRAALAAGQWDIILCDYRLPSFDVLAAIKIAHESGHDLPFIVVSGAVMEETAVEVLKAGAHDFVVKDRLARLVPAITRELREAEIRRERRQALEDLKRAVQARDDFLAIASHELKTPLTTLRLQVWSAFRLIDDRVGEGVRDKLIAKLAAAEHQVERLTALIDRLLDVTRMTSGRVQPERRDTDLAKIVRAVVSRSQEQDGVSIAVDSDGPVVGSWDPMLLETIVSNLVSNALKFGGGKPVEVAVSADGGLATFRVTDHGIGIEPSDQTRIFQRFERSIPERHFGGFGVGLWIARLATEAHDGRIRVSSAPGAGSTFVVELPRTART